MSSSPLTVAEISTLRESGELIVQYVLPLSVGSACWGIYLAMACKALRTLRARGLRNSIPRASLFVLVVIMLFLSTANLFCSFAEFFVQVVNLFLATDIPSLAERIHAADLYKFRLYFAYLVLFQVEVLLGDGIVIWRTWALWESQTRVVLFPIVLWLTSLVLFIVWVATSSGFTYIYTASQAVSIAANGLSTALIGYRAWSHRHTLKLSGYSRSTFIQKILALLVESGCIYLIMVLFDVVSHAMIMASYTPWSIFINCVDCAVIQGLGLYPTLIIILVEQRKTMWDHTESDDFPRSVTTIHFNMTSSTCPEDFHALESRRSRVNNLKSTRGSV